MPFSHLRPHNYLTSASTEDPRMGSIIQPYSERSYDLARVVLLGVPTDEGVRRNGGRVGASQAPAAIRGFLDKLTPYHSESLDLTRLNIVDLGDVLGESLEEQHEHAKSIVAKAIQDGKIVVALGGGHDVTYPLASGYREGHGDNFSLINVDAHLDVRERKEGLHHSGSSFRLLIEVGVLDGKNFTEYGIQQYAASRTHIEWVRARGATVRMLDTITSPVGEIRERLSRNSYLSFDIDAVRASDAPGCSAPSPIGFSAQDALGITFTAGALGVRMLDIVEVNPLHDIDGLTSRLAARMILSFLAGTMTR